MEQLETLTLQLQLLNAGGLLQLYLFFKNISSGYFQWLKAVNFFCKKGSVEIAGLGSKYAFAYDTSFNGKNFLNRLHLIKTNTSWNRDFYQIFAWISFLRQKIKTDIVQSGFRILFINLNLSPWHVAISNLIKKWLSSSITKLLDRPC